VTYTSLLCPGQPCSASRLHGPQLQICPPVLIYAPLGIYYYMRINTRNKFVMLNITLYLPKIIFLPLGIYYYMRINTRNKFVMLNITLYLPKIIFLTLQLVICHVPQWLTLMVPRANQSRVLGRWVMRVGPVARVDRYPAPRDPRISGDRSHAPGIRLLRPS
jgi:hypothetical protein